MKAIAKALAAGVLLLASVAHAAGTPGSILALTARIYGSPSKLGVITVAGSSLTNATTAVPFTITAGMLIMVECNAAVNVGPGSSAHATLTNAAYKPYLPAVSNGGRAYFLMTGTALAVIGTGDCAVFEMLNP